MSFTVLLTGSIIVATAVVTTCSSPVNYTDSTTLMCSGSICIAMPCGCGSFILDGAYDSRWDSVKPMTGSAATTKFVPTTISGSSRRARVVARCGEVYLYDDKTIEVDRDSAEMLPRGVPPPSIGGVGFGPSPSLATDRTICELSLPSERGMRMSINLADPVSSGKYSET